MPHATFDPRAVTPVTPVVDLLIDEWRKRAGANGNYFRSRLKGQWGISPQNERELNAAGAKTRKPRGRLGPASIWTTGQHIRDD